jgi:hypothetical protein
MRAQQRKNLRVQLRIIPQVSARNPLRSAPGGRAFASLKISISRSAPAMVVREERASKHHATSQRNSFKNLIRSLA